MKKITKKILFIVLACAIACLIGIPAIINRHSDHIAMINKYSDRIAGIAEDPATTEMTITEAIKSNAIDTETLAGAEHMKDITTDDILPYCNITSTETFSDELSTKEFDFDTNIAVFLYDCKKITAVSAMNDIVYVFYLTNSGNEVIVSFANTGFFDMLVYNPAKDDAEYISDNKFILYKNFKHGSYYKVPEE